MRKKIFLPIFLLLATLTAAQNFEEKYAAPFDSSKAQFPLLNYFTGEQWEKIWLLPITVPVVEEEALKKSPIFSGYDSPVFGKTDLKFEFHPFIADSGDTTEQEYDEFVSELATDPVTTRFPYAISIMEGLLRACGFVYPESYPVLYRRTDGSERMGYLLISPINNERVITTKELVTLQNTTSTYPVDARSYLKLRLIDILVGNWVNEPLQIQWVNHEGMWRPVPGRYKRAFSKFEGLLPDLFTSIAPQWNSFEKEYPDIESLIWNSKNLDRRVLSFISKKEWAEITSEVISSLSSAKILESVNYLPEVLRYNIGVDLFEIIIARKNKLTGISEDYFDFINQSPEIFTSGADDTLKIKKDSLLTTLFLVKENRSKSFDSRVTDEIRIFLCDGDDHVYVENPEANSTKLQIVGEGGNDSYTDNNYSPGFSLIDFLGLGNYKSFVYDNEETSEIKLGGNSRFYDKKPSQPDLKVNIINPGERTRGNTFYVAPVVAFSDENGFIIGVSPVYTDYAFAKKPFNNRLIGIASYATASGAYRLYLGGIINSFINDYTVTLEAETSEQMIARYYGYGNDISFTKSTYNDGGYNLDQEFLRAGINVAHNYSDKFSFSVGFNYKYSEAYPDSLGLLQTFPTDNIGIGPFKYLNLYSELGYDSRDDILYPRSGIASRIRMGYYPRALDSKEDFWKFEVESDFYLTYNLFTEMTTSLKTGGGKVWNDYPFFESIMIGGEKTLPGYSDYRFAGDASVYTILSQNIVLSDIRFIVKGKLGMKLLGSVGRVFSRGDLSDKWHHSKGAGLWVNGFNETMFSALTFAKSKETFTIYFSINFKI